MTTITSRLLQGSAWSVAQQLSINVRNGSLEKVFVEIEKKTNYVFFYDASVLQKAKRMAVEMKDARVENVICFLLKGQVVDFCDSRSDYFCDEGDIEAGSSWDDGGGSFGCRR